VCDIHATQRVRNPLKAHAKTLSTLVQIGIRMLANIACKRYPINLRRWFDPRALRLGPLQPAHNARNPHIKPPRNIGYCKPFTITNG
jgi:hypothetical protein